MAEQSTAEIARKAEEIYSGQLRELMGALHDRVAAAQDLARNLLREVGTREWEYSWLAEGMGLTFGPTSLEDGGIYIEYSIGQEYPTEGFVSYEFLDDPKPVLDEIRAEIVAEKAASAQDWKDRRRAQLERELAELNEK